MLYYEYMNKSSEDQVLEGEVIEPDNDIKKQNSKFVKTTKERKPTYRQIKFANAYKEGNTMGNATKSAIKAGYSEVSASVQGSKLLNNRKVLKILNDSVEEAEGVIRGLMVSGETGTIQLAAAKEVLDRTIGKPIQRSENVNINITVESMLES